MSGVTGISISIRGSSPVLSGSESRSSSAVVVVLGVELFFIVSATQREE